MKKTRRKRTEEEKHRAYVKRSRSGKYKKYKSSETVFGPSLPASVNPRTPAFLKAAAHIMRKSLR
jgi:hypothetical protein